MPAKDRQNSPSLMLYGPGLRRTLMLQSSSLSESFCLLMIQFILTKINLPGHP
nr:hypothetical protein Q903MT_gene4698 [Picea sitchensis]